MVARKGQFAPIPHAEIDKYLVVLGGAAWLVYTVLYRFRPHDGEGDTYPSLETIGKKTGLSRSTVKRELNRLSGADGVLEAYGLLPLIEVIGARNKGRFTSNRYVFLDPTKPP